VKVFDRTEDDHFIMLACDGIWDCLTNSDTCAKLDRYVKDLGPLEKVDKGKLT